MGVLDVLAEKYELIVLRRSLYAKYVARNGVCSFPFWTQISIENVKAAHFVIYTLSYPFLVLLCDLSAE